MGRGVDSSYHVMADFYDECLNPQAHPLNARVRRELLHAVMPQVRAVCELGCGTGETALAFARRGYKVFAVDLSRTMCRITREKARRERLAIRVTRADLCSFRLPQPVDLVTCELNVLNHVSRRGDLERAFRAVARALRPGGYFYFDVNTLRTFEHLSHLRRWGESPRFAALFTGSYQRHQRKASLDVDWFLPVGKLYRRVHERTKLICWTPREMRAALRRAGFRILVCRPAGRMRPFAPADVFYLARRRGPTN
jgi:SAM-dependent methyltransferase